MDIGERCERSVLRERSAERDADEHTRVLETAPGSFEDTVETPIPGDVLAAAQAHREAERLARGTADGGKRAAQDPEAPDAPDAREPMLVAEVPEATDAGTPAETRSTAGSARAAAAAAAEAVPATAAGATTAAGAVPATATGTTTAPAAATEVGAGTRSASVAATPSLLARRAPRASRSLLVRFDGPRAIEVPLAAAILLAASVALAAGFAAIDPGAIRFAALDRHAAALERWQEGSDARLAAQIAAIEAPLRALRREALLRGIPPEAPSPCLPSDPATHLTGHLEEAARLSAALARKAAGTRSRDALLPSRSPIDLSSDVPIDASGWKPGTIHVSSREGERADPFNGEERIHKGIDIAAPLGTPVIAPADGTVVFAGRIDPNVDHARSLLGRYVEIRHGATGFTTIYAHLSKADVHTGDRVRLGEKLGEVGTSGRSTAPHLHYQVMKDGEAVNPLEFIDDVVLIRDGDAIFYARAPDATAGSGRGAKETL